MDKLREWRNVPLSFVKDVIDVTPSEQQLDGLAKIGKTKRLSIRSGHGTGKDAFASWIILWFMTTRPYAKVPCTAPTARQLSDVLWSELSKWLRQSKVADEFIIQKDKMFHKDAPKEWWCRAISPSVKSSKEEQAETLAGLHGDHMLIVADEASGIPDPVFIPLEGAMTQEDNRVLLIGNMTRNSGYFYDSHFDPLLSSHWTRLHWDSRKSSNVQKSYVDYMLSKYGEESNVFRIRVVGDPPLEDERTFIPLAWAQSCIGNQIEATEDDPTYLGVDVARYGEDKSIILPRKGLKILPWQSFQGMNTITLGGHILETFRDLEAEGIGIDEIGVGSGVLDWLHKIPESRKYVYGVNVANVSSNNKRFHRLRDELWWRMRDRCQRQQYSFPDSTAAEREMSNELCNELSALTYDFDTNGAYVVESKRQAKLRGVASPNIADALGLTEYFYSTAHLLFRKRQKKETKKRSFKNLDQTPSAEHSWMAM